MSELRRLRYFLAVASDRNFTRAAERLHVAQPALSRQVRQLEQELGVELLRRTTHAVEVTDAGRYLVEHGARVLTAADELWRAVGEFGAGAQGGVVVGYGMSAGYETAPRLLQDMAKKLPKLSVATRVLSTAEIVSGVLDRVLDAGLVRCPPAADGIESRLLRLEPQGVLLRHDHALAQTTAVRLADLGEEALLVHPRAANPGHYDTVLELCRAAGVEPRLLERSLTVDLSQTPIIDGHAVAIVGESARAGLLSDLVWLPLDPPAALEVRLLARAAGRTPAAERFLDAAVELAEELGWLRLPAPP